MKLEMPATFKLREARQGRYYDHQSSAAMNAFTEKCWPPWTPHSRDSRKTRIWVAIFTGAGDKSFCSGMDLGEAIRS